VHSPHLHHSNDLLSLLSGGDFTANCRLCASVVSVIDENREWFRALKPKATLAPIALMTFSRFICEQSAYATYDAMRMALIRFAQFVLVEKLADCLQLGRDLLLVLMKLSKINEFETIWRDLLHNPQRFQLPNFSGLPLPSP
jgi:integrator complex subunit 3